jgi:hypothetical protein
VAQLPPRPSQAVRTGSSSLPHSRSMGGSGVRSSASVEGASAMAVRGGGGPTSQIMEDYESDEGVPSRLARLPSQNSQQFNQSRGGPASARGVPNQYSRGGPPSSQQDSRLYAPPNTSRYPIPPRSESNMGGFQTGGAGASLYSAIAPSKPTPSEQHYYHHHGPEGPGASRGYAASSVGGRSNPGGNASTRGPRAAEVEVALQSIQASLAALHERLNRVESQRKSNSSLGTMVFGSNSILGMSYQALANAFHDIALLLGIANDRRGGRAAPSSYQSNGNDHRSGNRAESVAGQSTTSKRRGVAVGGGDGSGRGKRWSAILRLLMATINLSLRLALDLTSFTVVFSLILLVIKRATGKGDPLLLLRFIRRYSDLGLGTGTTKMEKVKAN